MSTATTLIRTKQSVDGPPEREEVPWIINTIPAELDLIPMDYEHIRAQKDNSARIGRDFMRPAPRRER